EEGATFDILDKRDSEILALRQSWDYLVTKKQTLEVGWQLREFETEYEYVGTREFDNPLARIRHDYEEELTDLAAFFEDRQGAAYLADQFNLSDELTLELGLRYDNHSLTSESFVSPRFNLAHAIGERSVLRAAWGRFNQSQRTYELGVEDGEREFHPVERSEHRILGVETFVDRGVAAPGLVLRVEVYQREVGNPRPRYENLFEPLNTFPEVEPDRVLTVPRRSVAEGVEVFLRSGFGRKVGWWINYTYATTEDDVDGMWVPRLFDQKHALNLDLDYRISDAWRLNVAWRHHTGWPTTPVSVGQVQDDEGEVEFVPVLGPMNSDRLPAYHRLDLRASRRWEARRGLVDFFVDIQNLYDRQNIGGFDIEIDDEDGTLVRLGEAWAGILPSAGISFEF
ncbi:MAG: TonB-dependent receptor, partial [Acidobacteriota bacterium]|nr:TonB-dependent receptor [Acidobacteriota bacterium]